MNFQDEVFTILCVLDVVSKDIGNMIYEINTINKKEELKNRLSLIARFATEFEKCLSESEDRVVNVDSFKKFCLKNRKSLIENASYMKPPVQQILADYSNEVVDEAIKES